MEAIRVTTQAHNGVLSIVLPENFNDKDLEVVIQIKEEQPKVSKTFAEIAKERMEDFGKAPYPDFPITKYDAYNQ